MRSFVSAVGLSLGLIVGLAACDSDPNGFIPEVCDPGQLEVETLVEGAGPSTVRSSSRIVANYVGRLVVTQDTFDTGESTEFNLQTVIAGFRQGLTGARIGEQRRLIIPPDLGYGGRARTGIPACSTLEFEVEVLDIVG
ncbi:MAG: FKBP-type peptidyl-prolyl cis-trans isomerase [Bacteroidota bacterium]